MSSDYKPVVFSNINKQREKINHNARNRDPVIISDIYSSLLVSLAPKHRRWLLQGFNYPFPASIQFGMT
jgi:hypothetical protein